MSGGGCSRAYYPVPSGERNSSRAALPWRPSRSKSELNHSQPQSSPGPAHVLIACSDFRIGGHSTHTLNFGRALRRRGCRVGAIVPEPFGELYGDFAESLDYVCVLRRGLESRSRYIRRLV